ncbi:unnamed protein product [Amoebophrya sp. A25]|nr:unnamed protein product [Amoebophrya sp. A25]|eukprot:GSA25T00018878001.1
MKMDSDRALKNRNFALALLRGGACADEEGESATWVGCDKCNQWRLLSRKCFERAKDISPFHCRHLDSTECATPDDEDPAYKDDLLLLGGRVMEAMVEEEVKRVERLQAGMGKNIDARQLDAEDDNIQLSRSAPPPIPKSSTTWSWCTSSDGVKVVSSKDEQDQESNLASPEPLKSWMKTTSSAAPKASLKRQQSEATSTADSNDIVVNSNTCSELSNQARLELYSDRELKRVGGVALDPLLFYEEEITSEKLKRQKFHEEAATGNPLFHGQETALSNTRGTPSPAADRWNDLLRNGPQRRRSGIDRFIREHGLPSPAPKSDVVEGNRSFLASGNDKISDVANLGKSGREAVDAFATEFAKNTASTLASTSSASSLGCTLNSMPRYPAFSRLLSDELAQIERSMPQQAPYLEAHLDTIRQLLPIVHRKTTNVSGLPMHGQSPQENARLHIVQKIRALQGIFQSLEKQQERRKYRK